MKKRRLPLTPPQSDEEGVRRAQEIMADLRDQGGVAVEQFMADRQAAFLSLDKAKIMGYFRRYGGGEVIPSTDVAFWAGVHKARTGDIYFPEEERVNSKRWLMIIGSQPLDGGTLNGKGEEPLRSLMRDERWREWFRARCIREASSDQWYAIVQRVDYIIREEVGEEEAATLSAWLKETARERIENE